MIEVFLTVWEVFFVYLMATKDSADGFYMATLTAVAGSYLASALIEFLGSSRVVTPKHPKLYLIRAFLVVFTAFAHGWYVPGVLLGITYVFLFVNHFASRPVATIDIETGMVAYPRDLEDMRVSFGREWRRLAPEGEERRSTITSTSGEPPPHRIVQIDSAQHEERVLGHFLREEVNRRRATDTTRERTEKEKEPIRFEGHPDDAKRRVTIRRKDT